MRAVYIADWIANAVTTTDSEVDKGIDFIKKNTFN